MKLKRRTLTLTEILNKPAKAEKRCKRCNRRHSGACSTWKRKHKGITIHTVVSPSRRKEIKDQAASAPKSAST